MLYNRLGRIDLWRTCLLGSYKNFLLKYKLMSYPFRVQFDRRGRGRPGGGEGVGRGERSGPGGKEGARGKGVGRGGLGCCTLCIPTAKISYSIFKAFSGDGTIPLQKLFNYWLLRDILALHSRRSKFLINTIFLCLSFFLHWPNFEIKTVNWSLREEVHGLLTQISPRKWSRVVPIFPQG